jgi:hypothetical protein
VLSIFEQALGHTHPHVAIALNNMTLLLQEINHLAEAEPYSRRAASVLLDFTRRTGHEHPRLKVTLAYYRRILTELGRSDAEIRAELDRLESGKP